MSGRIDVLDHYPLNSPWIRGIIARYWLPVWFAANAIVGIANSARDTTLLYFDARLYLDATKTWLAGGDPWSVSLAGNYFAAPPPTLLVHAPLALLPIDLGVAITASLVILGAIATVRLLRLPWWWILFPPLVQCVLSANVQGLLIPLILLRIGWLAGLLKIYAGVPVTILGKWRQIAILAGIIVVTIPMLPWATFLDRYPEISANLEEQTHYALPTITLIAAAPFALVAMSLVGRERAAWLAVPALWPSQQYYYGSLAMGTRDRIAVAVVAVPVPGSGLLALFVVAFLAWRAGARPHLPDGWSARARTFGVVTRRTGPVDSDP